MKLLEKIQEMCLDKLYWIDLFRMDNIFGIFVGYRKAIIATELLCVICVLVYALQRI